jgi:hypothetical protein
MLPADKNGGWRNEMLHYTMSERPDRAPGKSDFHEGKEYASIQVFPCDNFPAAAVAAIQMLDFARANNKDRHLASKRYRDNLSFSAKNL